MFVADVKCSQATWQTAPNSRANSAKGFPIYLPVLTDILSSIAGCIGDCLLYSGGSWGGDRHQYMDKCSKRWRWIKGWVQVYRHHVRSVFNTFSPTSSLVLPVLFQFTNSFLFQFLFCSQLIIFRFYSVQLQSLVFIRFSSEPFLF